MKVRFAKALWGMTETMEAALDRIAVAGYEGIEAPNWRPMAEWAALARPRGLALIAQAYPLTVADARALIDEANAAGALLLNLHAGKDWWDEATARSFWAGVMPAVQASPVPVVFEVHRGRILMTPWTTAKWLAEFPDLRITADFSHFTCVCESLLHDQEAALAKCIARSDYIHARVGHEEGPQVNDPRAPEWSGHVARFTEWWQAIVDHRRAEGAKETWITPEFGPPNYLPTLPYTRQPVADLWDVCLWMRGNLAAGLNDLG